MVEAVDTGKLAAEQRKNVKTVLIVGELNTISSSNLIRAVVNSRPEAPGGQFGCNESSFEEDFSEMCQTGRWTAMEHSRNLFQEMSCAGPHW